MMKKTIENSQAWKKLAAHAEKTDSDLRLTTLFEKDTKRFKSLTFHAPGIFLDLSKQQISDEVLNELIALAQTGELEKKRDAMFAGEHINKTENRQALHTALRGSSPCYQQQVQNTLQQIFAYAKKVRDNDNITDIVNIGIGGSDLGPRMAYSALLPFTHPKKRFHFVSNMDAFDIARTLKELKPENTLFIISSKSFTTQETLANALLAKSWLEASGEYKFTDHAAAVTANSEKARALDINTIFTFSEWVGGRYSLWGPVGLSLTIAIGEEKFREFLRGAYDMDMHFISAPLKQNIPVLLALTDIWNRNFLNRPTRCVAPYHQGLEKLPTYLQQLEMESNGKSTSMDGNPLPYATSPVVWGEAGNNSQHAFFQMLHQGTDVIPVDFILVKKQIYPAFQQNAHIKNLLRKQHQALLMNAVAQSHALMTGKTYGVAFKEIQEKKPCLNASMHKLLASHQTFEGNRPSTTIVLEELSPYALGAFIALHEHRTFTAGAIWNINSFDQWGVELGKTIALLLLKDISTDEKSLLNTSTADLVGYLNSSPN